MAPSVLAGSLATQRWEWLLVFPFAGKPRAYQNGSLQPVIEIKPNILCDPLMDYVTLSIDPGTLPDLSRMVFQVFITTQGGRLLLDQSPPVSSERSPGMPSAPLLLAFSDTFQAATPAQAHRRWDGAHTGPFGSRHGLAHVLSNMDIYDIPVVFLDLKDPTSLAALDYVNGIPLVKDLINRDLLIVPDTAFAKPDPISLISSKNTALTFNLPGSLFVFAADSTIQPGYIFQFFSLPDQTHLLNQSGRILIPLSDLSKSNSPIQATVEGLDLEIRRQLIYTALSPDPTDLVVLGGSLPNSTWGNADASEVSMAYIASHPWIVPLNGDQLQTMGSQSANQTMDPQPTTIQPYPIYVSSSELIGFGSELLKERIIQDLAIASHNSITEAAWQMFFSLTSANADSLSSQLNFQYLNQVESLLAASRWLKDPTDRSDCNEDIDLDLFYECVLSNEHFFAIFETDGGRLSFLFNRIEDQVHQLVGPQSQLTVGLSDPSLWDIHKGPGADPSEIPGAGSDLEEPFRSYSVSSMGENTITMTRFDGLVQKTYTLIENGLILDCRSDQPITLRIPLVLDPQARFQTGWRNRYNSLSTKDSFIWGLNDGLTIEIRSTAPMTSHDFTESRSSITIPENPNLDYPAGHYLPFPMALVDVRGSGRFTIQILINP